MYSFFGRRATRVFPATADVERVGYANGSDGLTVFIKEPRTASERRNAFRPKHKMQTNQRIEKFAVSGWKEGE